MKEAASIFRSALLVRWWCVVAQRERQTDRKEGRGEEDTRKKKRNN